MLGFIEENYSKKIFNDQLTKLKLINTIRLIGIN